MNYARIQNNVIIETFTPPEEFSIEDCFHPSIASQFVEVAGDVQAGWIVHEDGVITPSVAETLVA